MKRDIYKEITDKIVAELERGAIPWVQPWSRRGLTVDLPENATSKRRYSGINVLILWDAAINGNYTSARWLTYKQAKAAGGHVRRGERGTMIFYISKFIPEKERKLAEEENREPRAIPFLRSYRVFNAAQCEGLPDELIEMLPDCEKIDRAEKLIEGTGAKVCIGGLRAYYDLLSDTVHLPPQPAFEDQTNYYSIAFHELGHWTGAEHRLARKLSSKKNSKSYAFEELIAELCAAFTSAAIQIRPTVRHAAYIATWIKLLRDDKRAIFRAASAAAKATGYIVPVRSSPGGAPVEKSWVYGEIAA